MRVVTLTIYGMPQPKGSTRAFKRGPRIIVTSDNPSLAKWESLIRFEANRVIRQDPRLFEGPVRLLVTFYIPRPPSVSAKARPSPTVKPDCSKLVRAAEDPLSGVLFRDDAQVCRIVAEKVYTDGPAKAVITVSEMPSGGLIDV